MDEENIDVQKKSGKKRKINWPYYLAELLVVFIGVTAGFLLNNWRMDQAEIRLEQKYLNSFYNDILNDEATLDSLLVREKAKEDTLLEVLKKSIIVDKPLTEELAQIVVKKMMYLEWFSPSNDTYEDIINSGNLNIISDYTLKEQISSYYKFITEVKNVEQYFLDHMDNYGFPILYKNYHLFKLEFVNEESYQSLEFTNMYLGIFALLQQNNKIYERALVRNRELKVELERVLED